MNAYIKTLRLCGIKNIDKEIELQFYNKTLPKHVTVTNHNIKAIYGENGAGKSGIVHAMDIYKKVLLKKNYLNDSNIQKN